MYRNFKVVKHSCFVAERLPARTLGASLTRPRQNGFVGLANGFIRAGNVILAGAGVTMFLPQ
ncbi:MAG: hypothetical protein A3H23_04615 [Planctomycetes bacterium RIFCSPLOWO2_12_FULL_40_19]|nr:MAG: hypothetical protein A3H23_04615 [Planctomycetes bacterium RIFCSPLOWO2_12_FULL_40_19]